MESRKEIYFCTHSNLEVIRKGDSNNDIKFINAIPKNFKIIKLYPKKKKNSLIANIKLNKNILLASLSWKKIFIIRQARPGIIQTILKPFFKHKIILYLGCSITYLEKIAFRKNQEYSKNNDILSKILIKIDSLIQNFVLNHADYCIVENIRIKKILIRNGVNKSKIIMAPYYVQNYFLNSKNTNFDPLKKSPFILGYTGRFHKYDKIDYLIEALYLLKKKKFLVKLWLIGDGPTRKDILKAVKDNNLEQEVTFFGSQSHQNVVKLMKKMHCLVLPMVKHICPSTIAIKILESILMGKIVITNNSGYNKSLFQPYPNLVLEDIANPVVMSNLIIKIIKNYQFYSDKFQEIKKYQLNFHNQEKFNNQVQKVFKTG